MPKYIFIVESNCVDQAHEAEFNEWYNTKHVPDLIQAGSVKSASRYVLYKKGNIVAGKGMVFEPADPGEIRGKYLSIYEYETEDIDATLAEQERKLPEILRGRMSDTIKTTFRGLYKQILTLNKP